MFRTILIYSVIKDNWCSIVLKVRENMSMPHVSTLKLFFAVRTHSGRIVSCSKTDTKTHDSKALGNFARHHADSQQKPICMKPMTAPVAPQFHHHNFTIKCE